MNSEELDKLDNASLGERELECRRNSKLLLQEAEICRITRIKRAFIPDSLADVLKNCPNCGSDSLSGSSLDYSCQPMLMVCQICKHEWFESNLPK